MTSPLAPGRSLGIVDRFLPVWILAAMGLGLLVAVVAPELGEVLPSFQIGSVSVPIAVGLLVMMYPVLKKVRYSTARVVAGDRKLLISSLVLNWVLGPALMFALACGDREAAAFLVALNSVFQVVAFSALGWFYLQILPTWLGLSTTSASFSLWAITASVLVFLGIALLAGYLSRQIGEATRGRAWYEATFLPRVGPFALYGLLLSIVVLFTLQGRQVLDRPLDVARIALPLLVYFVVMCGVAFLAGKLIGLPYERTTTLAFTAAGNNSELTIAVAIGTFGAASGQALAGIVGPLIEVPALMALVYLALWLRPRLFPARTNRLPDAAPPVLVAGGV